MVLFDALGVAPSSILLFSFLLIFAGAILVYGLGRSTKKYTGWIAAIISLVSTLLVIDVIVPATSVSGVMAGPYSWIPSS